MSIEPPGNSFRRELLTGARRPLLVADKAPRLVRDPADEESLGQVAVPRTETRRGNHRDRDRHRLAAERVLLDCAGWSGEVELVNLSAGGAMVRGADQARLWDTVALHLGAGPPLAGAIRWLKGDLAGIEFVTETQIECGARDRAALLLEIIRRNFPDSRIELEPVEVIGPSDTPAYGESQRGEIRHPLVWKGEVHFAFDSYPVRLRNISSGGALIDSAMPFPLGAELMLDLGAGVQVAARVGWANGDKFGLAFLSPFDLERLAGARPEVASHRWERPAFLDAASDTPSAPWTSGCLASLRAELEGFLKR